jgi:hypothetical protein
MTIRIIEKKPDKSVLKEVICRNCGVKLEYTPNDIRKYEGRDISGGPDGSWWITYPKCRERIILRSW